MLGLSSLSCLLFAQKDSSRLPVQIDFLSTYYQQDGEHSAVTGGIGTEQLNDYMSQVFVNIPLDSTQSIDANVQGNYYTSASTDNINTKVSSASSEDFRLQVGFGYNETVDSTAWGIQASMSVESDYLAYGLGTYRQWTWANDNRFFKWSAQFFHGKWGMYFPDELRDTDKASLPSNIRNTYQMGFTYGGVVNRRLRASLTFAPILQNGVLSTPFHRTYDTNNEVDIERLPQQRWQFPLSIQIRHHTLDAVISQLNYRFYTDDWRLQAHTLRLGLPIKFSPFFKLKPFVRYHQQTAANYFQPYAMHDPIADFRTSDFDLSNFESWKYGLGLEYSPLSLYFKNRKIGLKQLSLQASYYERSDGLAAFATILHLSFVRN